MVFKKSFGSIPLILISFVFIVFVEGLSISHLGAADPNYPTKPITLIVPLAPGGLADLGGRILAEALERQLKQPVAVNNKPGGGMTVGGYAVASAKPDGYTLGFLINPTAAPEAYTYFQSAPYTSADLQPICRVHSFFIGITVRGDSPWNNLQDLIEHARKNPGLKYAHNGKSTLQYVLMTSIAKAEKLHLVDVPHDGDGAQIPALLGGHVPIGTPAFSVVKPHMDAKRLKVLALSSERRVEIAPDIPATGELGYKQPYYSSFLALFAPKKTPGEIIKKINEAVRKVTQDREFQEKSKALGILVTYEDTESFEKYVAQFKTEMMNFFKEQGMVK